MRRALLGATLLGVLAVAGCGDEGATHATPPATPSVPDWRNSTYQVACSGLGGPSTANVPVTLQDGAGRTAPVDWLSGSTTLDVRLVTAVSGDVTGDGVPDEVVLLACTPTGSNGVSDEIQVLDANGARLARLTPSDKFRGGFPPAVQSIGVAAGGVTGSARYWTPSDPHCCPSKEATFTFTWAPATRSFTER